MIAFSRSHTSWSTALLTLPHGWGWALRARQSKDLGCSARMKLSPVLSEEFATANGFECRLLVIAHPMTSPVFSLNMRGDNTRRGCCPRISRPACGECSIQIISPRSGAQRRGSGSRATVARRFVKRLPCRAERRNRLRRTRPQA